MIYRVKATKDVGKEPRTFAFVVETARQAEGKPPPEITFSALPPGGTVINVRELEGALVQLGAEPYTVRSVGMSSCAAVIFRYEDDDKEQHAYLYHANSGRVPWDKFGEIMKTLDVPENRYKRVQVIYAHPNKQGPGYDEYMGELERWLRSAVVVEVSEVPGQIFGMNQGTVVGY